MKPFRVTAQLANAVVTHDGAVYLDGLLSWSAWQRMPREERDALPHPNLTDAPTDFALPLARWTAPAPSGCHPSLLDAEGRAWGWCASVAQATWIAEETRHVRRKVDIQQMARWTPGGKLNTAGGTPIKHWDLPYAARLASELTWWCVGDSDAVREMLRDVHFVGKVHNHGNGEVLEWLVEECDEDRSVTHDGHAMRSIPTTIGALHGHSEIAAIRAPYWHRSRRVECWVPRGDVTC